MELRRLMITLLVLFFLGMGKAERSGDLETFVLYFRQGDEKIPVTIEMDAKEKIAYVASKNSNQNATSSSLYDYKAKVIAFKDSTKNTCYLERMQDPSLIYERRLLRTLRNQVLLGSPDMLFAQTPALSHNQIHVFGGRTVQRFCNGMKVFKISDQHMHLGRKKRQISKEGFLERTYSHHEQHTQTYAKFGHETLSFKGGANKLINKFTPSHLLPVLNHVKGNKDTTAREHLSYSAQRYPAFRRQNHRRNIQLIRNQAAQNKNTSRSIRELPRTRTGLIVNPNTLANPTHVRANSLTSQISSQINSKPGEQGFLATGKFNLANAHAGGYRAEQYSMPRGSHVQNGRGLVLDNEKTQAIYGNYPNSYATKKHFQIPTSGIYPPYQIPTRDGINLQGSNGGDYQIQPAHQHKSNPYSIDNSGITSQNSKNPAFQILQSPTHFSNGQMPQTYTHGNFPSATDKMQPAVRHEHSNRDLHQRRTVQPSYPSQQLGPGGAGTKDYGLSSQSQVEVNQGNAQAGASSQGAIGGGTSQTQVQGGSSKGGTFQAQAQTGSNQGNAQSQAHGSETGAQSSASSQIAEIGQSQTQAHLSYESRIAQANAQTSSKIGSINTQSQGNHLGGQASSQSQGKGGTSSSAQVGFEDKGKSYSPSQSLHNPFTGQALASSHGGFQDGQSKTFVHGNLQTGSSYRATAEGSYGHPQPNTGPMAIALPGSNGVNLLTTDDTQVSQNGLDRSQFLLPPKVQQQGMTSNPGVGYLNGNSGHLINKATQSSHANRDRTPLINSRNQHTQQSQTMFPQSYPLISSNYPDLSTSHQQIPHSGLSGLPTISANGNHDQGRHIPKPLTYNQGYSGSLNQHLTSARNHDKSSENIQSQPKLIQQMYSGLSEMESNRGYPSQPADLSFNYDQTPVKTNGNIRHPYNYTPQNVNQQLTHKNSGSEPLIAPYHTGVQSLNSQGPIIQSQRNGPAPTLTGDLTQKQMQIIRNGFRTQTSDQAHTTIANPQLPSSLTEDRFNSNPTQRASSLNQGKSILQAQVQGIYFPYQTMRRESSSTNNGIIYPQQNSGEHPVVMNSNKRGMILNHGQINPSSLAPMPNIYLPSRKNGKTLVPQQGILTSNGRPIAISSQMTVSQEQQNAHNHAFPTGITNKPRNCGISACSNGFRFVKTVKICMSPCQ